MGQVVLFGDDKQLPPIGVGNAFGNLLQTGKIDRYDEIRH